jgi:hypothetical protein
MMMYSILLLVLLCMGCSSRPESMVALDQVIAKIDNAVAKEGLQAFGSGFLGPYPFKGLDLEYKSKEWVNLEESRKIFVQAVDTVLSAVNQDDEFAKHLRKTPFSSENLLLSIIFAHDNTNRYIGMLIMAHDEISYFLRDPVTFDTTKIYTETLEEAKQKLNLNNVGNYA